MYTVDDLIEDIKLRGSIPGSQGLFTPAKIASLMTDELRTVLVPQLLSVREDYFLTYVDLPATTTTYTIPEDAIGGKIKEAILVDANGNEVRRLARVSDPLTPWNGCHLQGSKLVLTSLPAEPTLRLYYYRRPLRLTTKSACAKVSAVTPTTVTVTTLPSTFTVGKKLTCVSSKPGFDTVLTSTEITAVASPVITLSTTTGIAIGDWLALEGYSPIPQIPVEAHPVLAQAVVVKLLEALGDVQGLSIAQAKLTQLQEAMFQVLTPRVESSPKTIIPQRVLFYG